LPPGSILYNERRTTQIVTLALHDALPIWYLVSVHGGDRPGILSAVTQVLAGRGCNVTDLTTRLAGGLFVVVAEVDVPATVDVAADRKSTRLNSSHVKISYAVFCLKKKKKA